MKARAGPGIEPGKAAAQPMHPQLAPPQVLDVYIRDLQFGSGRRFQVPRNRHHLIIVNVKAGDRVVALRLLRLLFDRQRLAFAVELHHPVAFGIIDVIPKDRGASFEISESFVKRVRSIEDIVAQNQCDCVLTDERLRNKKRLGDAFRFRLLAILDSQAPRVPVSEQLPETRQILRRGNQAKLPDTAFDERRQRIIDHRFVKDRLELFACHQRQREQAGTSTPGEDDAFHSPRRIDFQTSKCNAQRSREHIFARRDSRLVSPSQRSEDPS